MSAAARYKARVDGQTTIWDVWPQYLYRNKNENSNPMRCIHHSASQRQIFYDNMSEAFALKAQEGAMVLQSAEYYETPHKGGIWWRKEYPKLTAEDGSVDFLCKAKVSEHWTWEQMLGQWLVAAGQLFWQRPSTKAVGDSRTVCAKESMSKSRGKDHVARLKRRGGGGAGSESGLRSFGKRSLCFLMKWSSGEGTVAKR